MTLSIIPEAQKAAEDEARESRLALLGYTRSPIGYFVQAACLAYAERVQREAVAALPAEETDDVRSEIDRQSRELSNANAKLALSDRTCDELTKERDTLRLAFSEASHNAGPAFVAHEDLARCRTEIEELKKERDVAYATIEMIAPERNTAETERDTALAQLAEANAKIAEQTHYLEQTECGICGGLIYPKNQEPFEALLAEAQKDKERLDWLHKNWNTFLQQDNQNACPQLRSAIDAAMSSSHV